MSLPDPQTTPDEALVAEAQRGSREALGALLDRYQGKVYRLALRLAGDEHEAENILQEAFLQVFQKLPGFRGDARFSTWLYRIATNAALMNLRARRQRRLLSLDMYLPQFDGDGQHRRLDVDYSAAARVEEIVERRELREHIRQALARLPEIYRVAFVLCDLEELPAGEAAEIAGVEPAALRQRVHRARLMLRGYLGHLAGKERV